jgi:hypothetical protein
MINSNVLQNIADGMGIGHLFTDPPPPLPSNKRVALCSIWEHRTGEAKTVLQIHDFATRYTNNKNDVA